VAAIAISREIGTAGTDVGHAVARALGCSCVDREVILEAAARYQVAAGALTDVEEHPPSFWQRFDRERRRNLVFIRAALLERLATGACVVTGRVVPLLLRDVTAVLRVRVVASVDARVRRIMEEREVAEETAHAEIDAADQELTALVQWLFGLEARDSTPRRR
jgi:cytidylate kinase